MRGGIATPTVATAMQPRLWREGQSEPSSGKLAASAATDRSIHPGLYKEFVGKIKNLLFNGMVMWLEVLSSVLKVVG